MTKLQLTLSDVVNNVNDAEEFQTQISNDGSLVFVTNLQIFAQINAASLYRNNGGKLSLLGTLPVDPTFPIVSSGAASDDFTRFVILDLASLSGIGQGRLRQFTFDFATNTFTQIGGDLIFNDVNLPIASLNITKFGITPDNHYAAISYANTATTEPSVGAVLKIVDLTTPTPTVTSSVNFLGFSAGAYFFQLKPKHSPSVQTYLVLPSTGSTGKDLTHLKPVAPAQIAFYLVTNGVLTQIGNPILQPQFVLSAVPYTYKVCSKTLIAVGTALAVLPGQPTTTDQSQTIPAFNNNSLNGETTELRIYEFDGTNATLVFAKSVDNNIGDIAWYPDGKNIAVIYGAGFTNLVNIACTGTFLFPTTAPAVFQTHEVTTRDHQIQVHPDDFLRVAPTFVSILEFSANGQWLIIGGGGPTYPSNVVTTNLYSVQKVKSPNHECEKKKNKCKNVRCKVIRC